MVFYQYYHLPTFNKQDIAISSRKTLGWGTCVQFIVDNSFCNTNREIAKALGLWLRTHNWLTDDMDMPKSRWKLILPFLTWKSVSTNFVLTIFCSTLCSPAQVMLKFASSLYAYTSLLMNSIFQGTILRSYEPTWCPLLQKRKHKVMF